MCVCCVAVVYILYIHMAAASCICPIYTVHSPWLSSSMSPAGPTVASDLVVSVKSSLPSLATKIKATQWGTI